MCPCAPTGRGKCGLSIRGVKSAGFRSAGSFDCGKVFAADPEVEDLSEPPQATRSAESSAAATAAAPTRALAPEPMALVAGVATALVVAFDDNQLVVLVEADIDRAAVGLGHLDLPGRAVLGIALDGVGMTTLGDLQCSGLGLVGLGTSRAALTVVARRDRGPGPGRREGDYRASDDHGLA